MIELELPDNRSKKQNVVAICFDRKGKIISICGNSFEKSSGLQANLAKKAGSDKKVFNHAEIGCIARWRRYSDKNPYGIYIARMSKTKHLVNSTPCEVCTLALKIAGIKKIFHT